MRYPPPPPSKLPLARRDQLLTTFYDGAWQCELNGIICIATRNLARGEFDFWALYPGSETWFEQLGTITRLPAGFERVTK